MTDPKQRYDPKSDPDLDNDQREEALNRLNAWFAWYRSREDREALKIALPDPLDREALQDAWAFANDKATNGLLSKDDAAMHFIDRGGIEKFEDAGVLVRHGEGWRLVDYLRLNQTRGQQGRKAAVRSAIGRIGGTNSGAKRRALKDARDPNETKQLLRLPDGREGSGQDADRSTDMGMGTATDMGTATNEDADAPPPSGDPGAWTSPGSTPRGWMHVDPSDLETFGGLERLHARAAAAGLVEWGDLALFELAAMVERSSRKGENPAAYLATALHRWRDEPEGFGIVDLDRDQGLDWIARADAVRAKRIVGLLRDVDLANLEGCDEMLGTPGTSADFVNATYQRRMKVIERAVEGKKGRKT